MKKNLFLMFTMLCAMVIANAQNNALQITDEGTWALVEEIPETITDLTIEAWIKLDAEKDVTGYTGIIDCRGGTHTQAFILKDNTAEEVSLGYEWGGAWAYQPEGYSVEKGVWQHVALVISSADKNAKIFVNGDLKDIDDEYDLLGEEVVLGGTMRIAGGNDMAERTLVGLIDEIRIWNIARSASDIQADMYNEIAVNTTGLIAYYQCNETPGATELSDASGKGYHASFVGEDYNFVESDWAQDPTSISKNAINSISVFPNPATDIIRVKGELNTSAYKIFDITGRLVDSSIIRNSEISVKSLQKGIYFLEVTKGSRQYFSKFMKD